MHVLLYLVMISSELGQQVLNAPLEASLTKAQTDAATAQKTLATAQAQLLGLGK